MGRRRGGYTRAEVEQLNAARAGPPVNFGEIVRVFRGNLRGVLIWFEPKPMPDSWATSLKQRFSGNEPLTVGFGYPRGRSDFFVVHDLEMQRVVELALPNDGAVPLGHTPVPPATE